MDPSPPADIVLRCLPLEKFPSEILHNIFYFTTSISFFQLIQVNRKFFQIASESRELILHHLQHVPGIKLGLDDRSISTSDLFLIFRQRAASNLYGGNFTADCRNLEPSPNSHSIFDPQASNLTAHNHSAVVVKNGLKIKLNLHNNHPYGDTICSPYGDGHAKILQVVQRSSYLSVLYAWAPLQKSPTENSPPPEPNIPTDSVDGELSSGYECRDGLKQKVKVKVTRPHRKAASTSSHVRYHLLHYDLYRSDRPVFFPVPAHMSLRGEKLVPVHLAVHNRLECAILWDLPDTRRPTSSATVCLYKAEQLPRHEPGLYDVWVIYPFDHPARRSSALKSPNSCVHVSDPDSEEDTLEASGRGEYTQTQQPLPSDGDHKSTYGDDLRHLHRPLKPRTISFFKDGRRLSLFAPGSTTPFTTVLANEAIRSRMLSPFSQSRWPAATNTQWPRSFCRRVRRMNHTLINGHHYTLSLPFYTKHETVIRPNPPHLNPDPEDEAIIENDCITDMLCVGTARIPLPNACTTGRDDSIPCPQVLAIVQIRVRKAYDDCLHSGSKDDLPSGLPRPPRERRRRRTTNIDTDVQNLDHNIDIPDNTISIDTVDDTWNPLPFPEPHTVSDTDSDDEAPDPLSRTTVRAVARLWGWNGRSTSLTGLDTVSVSPRGERIALAQWDRVLIYAINPRGLCEEVWYDPISDGRSSHGGSDSDTISEVDHESVISVLDGETDGNPPSITGDVLVTDDQNVTMNAAVVDIGDDNNPATPPAVAASSFPIPDVVLGIPPPPSISSSTASSLSHLANTYSHTKDKNFGGYVIVLRPIVLKMDRGAVVRKMCWGLGRPTRAEDNEVSDEAEATLPESQEAELESAIGQDKVGKESETGNVSKKGEDLEDVEVTSSAKLSDPVSAGAEQSQQPNSTSRPIGETPEQLNTVPTALPTRPPLPAETSPHTRPVRLLRRETSDEEIPPAPFSDLKLTGQIKHIGRPPEYDTFPPRLVLDNGKDQKVLSDSTEAFLDDLLSKSEVTDSANAKIEPDEKAKGKEVDQEERKGREEVMQDGTLSVDEDEMDVTHEQMRPGTPIEAEADVPNPQAHETLEPSQRTQPTQIQSTIAGTPSDSRAQTPADQEIKPPTVPEPQTQPDLTSNPETETATEAQKRKPQKRIAENEFVVMTDRGIQVWDLSVWGKGRRVREALDCEDIMI